MVVRAQAGLAGLGARLERIEHLDGEAPLRCARGPLAEPCIGRAARAALRRSCSTGSSTGPARRKAVPVGGKRVVSLDVRRRPAPRRSPAASALGTAGRPVHMTWFPQSRSGRSSSSVPAAGEPISPLRSDPADVLAADRQGARRCAAALLGARFRGAGIRPTATRSSSRRAGSASRSPAAATGAACRAKSVVGA